MRIISKLQLLVVFPCFAATLSYAQKTALNANVYGGVSFFRGRAASSITGLATAAGGVYYTGNPYGNIAGFSYAAELEVKRITKHKLLFSIGAAFEHPKAVTRIDGIYSELSFPAIGAGDTGRLMMVHSFVTLSPAIGKRFTCRGVSIDVSAGVDIAIAVLATQIQEMEVGRSPYSARLNYNKPAVDPRPKLQLGLHYDRFGLLLAYAAGLRDYDTELYSDKQAFTNFLRAGVSYRLAYL